VPDTGFGGPSEPDSTNWFGTYWIDRDAATTTPFPSNMYPYESEPPSTTSFGEAPRWGRQLLGQLLPC